MRRSIVLLLLSMAGGATNGQVPPTLDATTVIKSYRPVGDAALVLEHKFGWLITYEDPVWAFPEEIVDLVPIRKPGTGRILAPRPGPLPIGALLSAAGDHPDRNDLVSKIVQAHDEAGNPGSFKGVSDGDYLHLIPTFAKDVNGKREAFVPLLDTPIYTPVEETTPSLAIRQILAEVSQTRGVQIIPSLPWWSNQDQLVFGPLKVKVAAEGQSARSLLSRIFKEADRPYIWRLLCEPSLADQQGHCVLNVREVYVDVTDESGNVVQKPLP